MTGFARAVLWAQYRMLVNLYPRRWGGAVLAGIVSALWYGAWMLAAVAIASLVSEMEDPDRMARIFAGGLLVVFLYWQTVPLALAATGASLDLKRLLVYPAPRGQLFAVEVLLRLSISLEMLLVLEGAAVGLWRNPGAPWWAPLAFIPFILFNLFLSVGVRELLARLLVRRRIREVVIFVIVMLAALPQYVATLSDPGDVKRAASVRQSILLPWPAAAEWASGQAPFVALLVLAGWVALAYWFGRSQLEKGLRFDATAALAADRASTEAGPLSGALFRLPSRLLPDPLGAMVEKEIRFLSRAPRFRLVFLMGFTFGIVIWMPVIIGRHRTPGFFSDNLLTWVSVYALLLLGEVLIWNVFGYDRSAAQLYHLAPVPFWQVLAAKNVTAVLFVLLELTLVTLVCLALRLPVTGAKVAEAFAVTLLLLLYLISFGNLSSVYHPKGLDPAQSWRSSARGFQILLILLYPVAALPLALPFLARYAFDSQIAFYAVLPLNFALGVALYRFGLESALEAAQQRKERHLAALSETEGPIAMNL